MPQIEIPFTVGQRVLWHGADAIVDRVTINAERDDVFEIVVPSDENQRHWCRAADLTLVEPVIEWERHGNYWLGDQWVAYDDGTLFHAGYNGTFDDPRAVAEATQKLWNEMRTKGDTDD